MTLRLASREFVLSVFLRSESDCDRKFVVYKIIKVFDQVKSCQKAICLCLRVA